MRGLKILALGLAGYITICLAAMPEVCISAVKSALVLCGTAVIPTLFPFFVCSSLFVSLGLAGYASKYLGGIMKPVFRTDGAGAVAVVLGVISGYPVGAKCAADLYRQNKLSKPEAERLLAFCNNSGPMFIMGTVGIAMYHSMRIGVLQYVIHIISSLLTGIIYARIHKGRVGVSHCAAKPGESTDDENVFEAVGNAIGGSVSTILKVCGFVVFFAVVGATLPRFTGSEFVYAFLEITGGINALTALSFDPALKLSFVSMFLALSGVSVLLQVGAVISEYGISIRPYVVGKILQSSLAFVLMYIILLVLKYKDCLNRLFGGETGVFVLASAGMNGADAALWNLSGAVEICGLCAAVIFTAVILCRMIGLKKQKLK